MSPIPYVRGQVIVLSLLVVATAALGAALVALACGLLALAWMLAWRRRYRSDVARAAAVTAGHRRRLDRVVAGDALITLVPACAVATALLAIASGPLIELDGARGVAIALAITTAGIYASSLIDWYVILPRVSGQLGARPCRAAIEEPEFPFPNTWKEVTRWWYIHRAAAALIFRVGLASALVFGFQGIPGLDEQARELAGKALLLFGGYSTAVIGRAVTQAGHARAIIGETAMVERRAGRRRPWFPLLKLPPIQFNGLRYVFDVSIEQVQLAETAPREAPKLPLPTSFETDPASLSLSDIDAVRKTTTKFRGCEGRCSGINWYCIENPRCFDPK